MNNHVIFYKVDDEIHTILKKIESQNGSTINMVIEIYLEIRSDVKGEKQNGTLNDVCYVDFDKHMILKLQSFWPLNPFDIEIISEEEEKQLRNLLDKSVTV